MMGSAIVFLQKLKMEVLIGQQLLDAVVSEALRLLEESHVEDR